MDNRKDDIIRAAMKGVRLYGMEGVRIQHIGKLAGTSTGNIYQYFESKDHLMRICFERVDRQIAHLFDRIKLKPEALAIHPEQEIYRLWTTYFRWLVSHPDETVFYYRFRDSPAFPGFDKQRDISYFSSFIMMIQLFESQFHIFEHVDYNILWLYVLTSTVMYAKYVVEGVLPNTSSTEENLFNLEMFGLRGLLDQKSDGK